MPQHKRKKDGWVTLWHCCSGLIWKVIFFLYFFRKQGQLRMKLRMKGNTACRTVSTWCACRCVSALRYRKPIKKGFHKALVKAMTYTDMHKIILAVSSLAFHLGGSSSMVSWHFLGVFYEMLILLWKPHIEVFHAVIWKFFCMEHSLRLEVWGVRTTDSYLGFSNGELNLWVTSRVISTERHRTKASRQKVRNAHQSLHVLQGCSDCMD